MQEAIDTSKAVVMDKTFVFILTNAELEEKVDSMPLFVAKVTPDDFIAYWITQTDRQMDWSLPKQKGSVGVNRWINISVEDLGQIL